jgi:hypothetical protein
MNTIVTYNFKEFDRILSEMDDSYFIQVENKLIFDYILILSDLFRNKASKEVSLIRLKKLIDYPNILSDKEILSVAEFMVLGEIVTLIPINEQRAPLNRLKKILSNPRDVVVGNNEKLVIMLLVRIIKTLGISQNFDDGLYYCIKGLDICRVTHTNYSLDYLYYYASLCYHEKKMFEDRDDMISKTVIAAYAEGDTHNINKFIKLIETDFNITVSEFMNSRF